MGVPEMSAVHDPTYEETRTSFWEIDGYRATVKRVNHGQALSQDLIKLIQERSEIEAKYAANLRNWSRQWNDLIGKGHEYGTTQAALRGVFTEAEKISELHLDVRDKLVNEIIVNIKGWQKENYHKPVVGPMKEFKEKDDAFRKAQRPWAKKYEKVQKAKKDFHLICKNLRTAEINERNQQADTSVSEDSKRKNILKIDDLEQKKNQTKSKYEESLQNITDYNARYMEDMQEIFKQCQEMEERRQKFFKETLFDVRNCLNLADNPEYSLIYSDLQQTISNADSDQDLKWWSQSYGVDMPMSWPTFEEYVPGQVPLSKKSTKRAAGTDIGDGITLTSIKKEDEVPQAYKARNDENRNQTRASTYSSDQQQVVEKDSSNVIHQRASTHRQPSYDTTLNPFGASEEEHDAEISEHVEPDNPFGDDDELADELEDDGRPGIPIRALYDYEGAEADELTFRAGDEFVKLEEEDEQGWCKGRLNGSVGLYPANYCVEI